MEHLTRHVLGPTQNHHLFSYKNRTVSFLQKSETFISSSSSLIEKPRICECANVHYKSFISSCTWLKSPLSGGSKFSASDLCTVSHDWLHASCAVTKSHLKLRVKVSSDRLSSLGRWKWSELHRHHSARWNSNITQWTKHIFKRRTPLGTCWRYSSVMSLRAPQYCVMRLDLYFVLFGRLSHDYHSYNSSYAAVAALGSLELHSRWCFVSCSAISHIRQNRNSN